MDKFETEDQYCMRLLYEGLVSLLESNRGLGFYNGDQGHMYYALAADGKRWTGDQHVDDADSNKTFQLIKKLSRLLNEDYRAETWFRKELTNWKGFCQFAVKASFAKAHPPQPE